MPRSLPLTSGASSSSGGRIGGRNRGRKFRESPPAEGLQLLSRQRCCLAFASMEILPAVAVWGCACVCSGLGRSVRSFGSFGRWSWNLKGFAGRLSSRIGEWPLTGWHRLQPSDSSVHARDCGTRACNTWQNETKRDVTIHLDFDYRQAVTQSQSAVVWCCAVQ